MKNYSLTAFKTNGENVLNDTFSSVNDEEAKKIGLIRLKENNYHKHTHRCVTSDGKLILFRR